MPVVKHIVARHPLSRFHTFHRPLKLPGGHEAWSIEEAYQKIVLLQHGLDAKVDELSQRDDLIWDPTLISAAVKQWLQQAGYNAINAKLLAEAPEIYCQICQYQMINKTAWARALGTVVLNCEDPLDLEFYVYSSKNEKVYSCGSSYRFGRVPQNYSGLNLWGQMIRELARSFHLNEEFTAPMLEALVSTPHFFAPFQKSVLLVADSQAGRFEEIQCGDVIPVSGGKYTNILSALSSRQFDPKAYMYIVILCGANESIRNYHTNHAAREERDRDWRALKNVLINEREDRPDDTILFCCAPDHPRIKGNAEHARYIQRSLHGTGIKCLNWEEKGNPFLHPNGRIQQQFFAKDGFHFNDEGAGLLWRHVQFMLHGLSVFNYKISNNPQSVSTDGFGGYSQYGQKRRHVDDGAGPSSRRE